MDGRVENTIKTRFFDVTTRKLDAFRCFYMFTRLDGGGIILEGVMVYNRTESVTFVMSQFHFGDEFGNSTEDKVMFPAVIQYLGAMEHEFKRALDEGFRPLHLDYGHLIAKRRRTIPPPSLKPVQCD